MIARLKLSLLRRRLSRLRKAHAEARASWSYWFHHGMTRDAAFWMARETRLWGEVTELRKRIERLEAC